MQDQVQVCSGMQNDVCGCLEDAMDAMGWFGKIAPGYFSHLGPHILGSPKQNVTKKCVKMHQNATCWKSDSEDIVLF